MWPSVRLPSLSSTFSGRPRRGVRRGFLPSTGNHVPTVGFRGNVQISERCIARSPRYPRFSHPLWLWAAAPCPRPCLGSVLICFWEFGVSDEFSGPAPSTVLSMKRHQPGARPCVTGWSPDSPLLAQDAPPHGQAVARWTSPSPRAGRGCACLRGGAVHAHGASGQHGRGSHVRPGSAPGTRGLSREAPPPLPAPCSPEPPSWG